MALIQTCQIQAIMTVPERLSFPAQLSNCNLATCWHIELSILGLLHLSISIHLALVVLWNSFFGWPWANLALLAQRQKNTGVQCLLFPISTGRLSQANLQQSPSAKTRMWTHGSNSDCCMTSLLRQPWEELVPWERTPWHWSKCVKFRPSWLFHTGCLSLHSCQTAILPHVGILNSTFSAFHSGSFMLGDGLKEWPAQLTAEMHGSMDAFSESSEYDVPLQFWFQRSICRLQFCTKSHKLGINPWQAPQHSLPPVFAPLHCTRW